ncbi:MAG: four helix bundle protein [Ruminococcus sp.]|nr:four helix bundle protein [Ruminococcus sp.]
MNDVKNYTDLLVWQKSMDLVEEVYRSIRCLPKDEIYALSSQIRRAVVSIPSNIAEGQQRRSTKDFVYFLSVARGSNAELQTQLYICRRLGYLQKSQIEPSIQLSNEIGRMLNSLIKKLSDN